MPTVRHPQARDDVTGHLPARVTVHGDSYAIEGETVDLPTDAHVRALADAYDMDADELRVGSATKDSDHETSARLIEDGVCPWCDEYEGDGVPQHASSAHPDQWTAYKEGDE